ncbi:hypothetical protein Q8791_23255 [Nocardiopsis sp. CT-R113]|uniref:HTH cro/C1-type domain-containing protein n=1 Tax=Nocardiopsis codii TaxID=3065942 RepID=A0ABU7KD35_9ACTN|nr:hypothetical protein [Nocardiopsis sp. CT-R113]MEE2040140.1 hypothetical protein [Nocardiopsis sp. CT-R113]
METSPPDAQHEAYTHAQTERDVPATVRAQRISAALNRARGIRGEKWSEIAAGARVSEPTLRHIRATGAMPQVKTIHGLESHFGWSAGTVLAIYNGEPAPEQAPITNEPAPPPGKGFRWAERPDGVTDYYLTFEIGGQEVDLRIADLDGEGREAMQAKLLAIKRRTSSLKV